VLVFRADGVDTQRLKNEYITSRWTAPPHSGPPSGAPSLTSTVNMFTMPLHLLGQRDD
jgi:hypothetical protein